MMLRYTFARDELAKRVEEAVAATLSAGLRTPDIFQPGFKRVGTDEMGDAVAEALL
jgi:3-isopropylmalate dehydrogenase